MHIFLKSDELHLAGPLIKLAPLSATLHMDGEVLHAPGTACQLSAIYVSACCFLTGSQVGNIKEFAIIR